MFEGVEVCQTEYVLMCVSNCAALNTHPELTGKRFVIHHLCFWSLFGGPVEGRAEAYLFNKNGGLTRVIGLVAFLYKSTQTTSFFSFNVSCQHNSAKTYFIRLKRTFKIHLFIYTGTASFSCTSAVWFKCLRWKRTRSRVPHMCRMSAALFALWFTVGLSAN